MSTPSHARPEPVGPAEVNDLSRGRAAPKVGRPFRILVLGLGAIAVMAPWPLLGILLTHTSFDKTSEAFMLFGGLTMFPLMVLALFGSVPEEVLIVLLMVAWLAAAVVPAVWLRRGLGSWKAIGVLLGVQAAFSLAQAVMGVLLIFGKNV